MAKLLLLLILFFFSPLLIPASPISTKNSTEFIHSCCSATLYPTLCFKSLSGYWSAVQQSPFQLARLATNLTVSRLRSLSVCVAHLRCSVPPSAARQAAALGDCTDTLGDAIDLANRTRFELQGLETLVGPEVEWRVSNAQTWLSAALTNEDTCADSLEGTAVRAAEMKLAGDDGMVSVTRRVQRVKKYTSNALALVNSLV